MALDLLSLENFGNTKGNTTFAKKPNYQHVTYLVIDVPTHLWICILQSLAKEAPFYYL
jgi:hypothetical protein